VLGIVELGTLVFVETFQHFEQEHTNLFPLAYDQFVCWEVQFNSCFLGGHEEVGANRVGFVLLVELSSTPCYLVYSPQCESYENLELFIPLLVGRNCKLVVPNNGVAFGCTEFGFLIIYFEILYNGSHLD